MIVMFLLLVLAAVILGFLGAVVKSLAFLLVIGIVIFACALLMAGARYRRGSHEERLESLERTRRWQRWR